MYKKVCYAGTLYAFLQFLLINDMELKDTIFILSEEMDKFLKNFPYDKFILKKNKKNFFYEKYGQYKNYKYLNSILNKDSIIYLQDHLYEAEYFLEKYKCYLLEDGTDSYNLKKINADQKKYKLKKFRINPLRKLLGGSLKRYPKYGFSNKILKIFMCGIFEVPETLKSKVEYINIRKKYSNLIFSKKEELLKIFNFNLHDLEKINNKKLLLTQPFSEDSVMSEEEKILIYEKIIEKNKGNEIIIKCHPREITDYKKYFPNIEILPKNFPAELFLFTDINLKEVITIFSTAALNLKSVSNINFIGTEKYPKLVERFGIIKTR